MVAIKLQKIVYFIDSDTLKMSARYMPDVDANRELLIFWLGGFSWVYR